MLSQKVQDAVNKQINNELYSMYAYLAMSAYCEHQQFRGAARWLRLQSQEELGHALRLYDFMIARGHRVVLEAINKPTAEFQSIPHVFQEAHRQEQQVTRQIDELYELAMNEKAFAAKVELEWFITEQVEEERSTRDIVHKFELVKADPAALLDLDRELAQRAADDSEA
jgi:ferritin